MHLLRFAAPSPQAEEAGCHRSASTSAHATPMTAQMQRTTGFWLVRFPCCGKRFPNQTQAVRHLVQAHGYDPTQAIQHCQALAQAVRLQRARDK